MGEKPDYLTLWTHYEGRGFDDKNRMVSTASLLISFAGVLLGSAVSVLVQEAAGPASCLGARHPEITSLLSALLVRVFAIHAERNFDAADKIKPHLEQEILSLIPAGAPEKASVLFLPTWISRTPPGAKVGRIFGMFTVISFGSAMVSAVLVVALAWWV